MTERARDESYVTDDRRDVPDADNVLSLARSGSEAEAETCAELLGGGGTDDVAVLRIEFGPASADRPSGESVDVPAEVASQSESFKVISIGHRSDRDGGVDDETSSIDVVVERIEESEGLAQVGIRTSETLDRWASAYDHVGLCLDSLSALQRHVGPDDAYHFLQVLSRHVARLDVRAHYHLDPEHHALATTYTFETLADGMVVAEDVDIAPEY